MVRGHHAASRRQHAEGHIGHPHKCVSRGRMYRQFTRTLCGHGAGVCCFLAGRLERRTCSTRTIDTHETCRTGHGHTRRVDAVPWVQEPHWPDRLGAAWWMETRICPA